MVEETDNIHGRPTTVSRHTPPGRKVGSIRLEEPVREDNTKDVTVWQEKYLNIKVIL